MLSDKIKTISKACNVTEVIFHGVVKNFHFFSTEKDVAGFIAGQIKKHCLKPAFKPIVASVPGSFEPHHKPFSPLKQGFCVIDFGVKINGYCSDFTRTVFLGHASKKEKRIYNMVLKAQKDALRQIAPQASAVKPYNAACKSLGKYAKNFVHGLGHGVGKRIHVKPYMKKKSKDILKENDVITVEPGVYFKGRFGIRVEDVFVVTKKGARPLTFFPRKLIEISFK